VPAVSPAKLVDAVLAAFSESGCQAQLVSSAKRNPREFLAVQPDGSPLGVCIYIWTITHGGASRSEDEYRIQLTGVSSPLKLHNAAKTVLLGWFPSDNVFGGFDLSKHSLFSSKSPSVQISLAALGSAHKFGWGFCQKDNSETAVAFRPDQMLNYCLGSEELHQLGAGTRMVRLLEKVAENKIVTADATLGLSTKRKRLVQTIEKWARDTNFSDSVLKAYGRTCAVTRAQLKLLDAAHIYPVGAQGSTDRVTNGIALSPTYHRAFDQGLIYLDLDMKMKINRRRVDVLEKLNLVDGLNAFSRQVGRLIHLPTDPRQQPSLEMIRKANSFRGIKG
jgi:putative restriction endonuclease